MPRGAAFPRFRTCARGNAFSPRNKIKKAEMSPANERVEIVSVRERPAEAEFFIRAFTERWASEASAPVYRDCITAAVSARNPLPQWYLLRSRDDGALLGGAGLITNDFISRMDLFPWLCALWIEEKFRGNALSALLISRAAEDAAKFGFPEIFCCTDHVGFYEKFGFSFVGVGFHPWGESSRIYSKPT